MSAELDMHRLPAHGQEKNTLTPIRVHQEGPEFVYF